MIPTLTAKAKWHSHQVNCSTCYKFSEAHVQEVEMTDFGKAWEVITQLKERRLLCPVGAILLNAAAKEDPDKHSRKPMFFPFVAKLGQTVYANHKGRWVTGKVTDRSINADGGIAGYEVEIPRPSLLKMEAPPERIYVNRFNVQRTEEVRIKKTATYNIQPVTTGFKLNIPE